MFKRLFGANASRKQVARGKSANRSQRLGFESLESRDLLAPVGPGISFDHLTGFTTEKGGTAIFHMHLTQQPTDKVTLTFNTSDPTEGKPSPVKLTFTTANWDHDHTLKVKGQANGHVIGAFHYQVNGNTTSADPNFNNLQMPTLSLTNFDQKPAVIVSPVLALHQKGLLTTELGGTAQFTVALTEPPNAGEIVVVPMHVSNAAEGKLDKSQLTFTAANFSTPQTVTVTGQDDGLLFKKAVKYTVVTDPVQSNDQNSFYAGQDPADVKVNNTQRTDVARFDGHYVGDFTGSVHGFPLNGQLDATVVNGNVTLTQLTIVVPNVPNFGTIVISTSGTGTVDNSGKLSLTFDDDGSLLANQTISNIPIVADPNGVPLLKGKVSFTIDASDFGLGNLPVTINFNISKSVVI